MAMSPHTATRLLLVSLLSLCTGCGFLVGDDGLIRDRKEDYKRAPEMPVATVPADLDSKKLQDLYAVPPVEESLLMAGEFEVPRPAPMVAGAGDEMVRIQKLGDEQWALIGAEPGQVWPEVRAFLSAAGIQLGRVDARQGIMESSWVELEGQPVASRFRFRIEQGVQRGTSELHILQMNRAGDGEGWPPASDNLDQEGEMLRAVSQYMANSTGSAPVSMLAEQAISGEGRISMQESPRGYTYIRVVLPYERAWASLGRALERSGFRIDDRDRSSGLYYVEYVGSGEEEERGWFDWLFGGDENPLEGRDLLVSAGALDEASVEIRLRAQDESRPLAKREEQGLLARIKGNIQ